MGDASVGFYLHSHAVIGGEDDIRNDHTAVIAEDLDGRPVKKNSQRDDTGGIRLQGSLMSCGKRVTKQRIARQ